VEAVDLPFLAVVEVEAVHPPFRAWEVAVAAVVHHLLCPALVAAVVEVVLLLRAVGVAWVY